MRCVLRALKRAKIPLWYTEGFNPHAYVMFSLPLSLGLSSTCEIMDIKLVEDMPFDELILRLNKALPEGIRILSAAEPVLKHTEIGTAEYFVSLTASCQTAILKQKFDEFINLEKIETEKLNKKKILVTIDIKPYIDIKKIDECEGKLEITLELPAGIPVNINANVVFDTFQKYSALEIMNFSIERTKILDTNGKLFS